MKECVLLDLPQVALLKKQYRLLQLRKLLSNYNIKDFNFSDLCKGEVCVCVCVGGGGGGGGEWMGYERRAQGEVCVWREGGMGGVRGG